MKEKYYQQAVAGTNLVLIDPELAKVFPDSASVNRALRALVMQRPRRRHHLAVRSKAHPTASDQPYSLRMRRVCIGLQAKSAKRSGHCSEVKQWLLVSKLDPQDVPVTDRGFCLRPIEGEAPGFPFAASMVSKPGFDLKLIQYLQ